MSAATAALAVLAMVAATSPAAPAAVPRVAGAAGEVNRQEAALRMVSARLQARQRWLFGKPSHTYERSPVSGTTYVSTIEQVAYKGSRRARSPKVGQIYPGLIWVGRAGDDGAGDGVVTEVMLPRRTRFAIDRTHPVRCYTGDSTGASHQIPGRRCPNRPTRGFYGWKFVPRGGVWHVPQGHWIQIVFPMRSSRPLRGLADTRNACLMGAVMNLSGWVVGRQWDAPVGNERCPTRDGHGPYQGVFVARR